MDLRVEKTEKAIRNAFLELRAKRALEKISVKELCQLAEINKSTFYAHYRDVYDLSDTLEAETVASILDSLPKEREYSVHSVEQFTRDLCLAFAAHISLINILFSGKEQNRLSVYIENSLKAVIFEKYPAFQGNLEKNILLSYCIQGGYHAYINNQSLTAEILTETISNIVKLLRPMWFSDTAENNL